MISERDRISFIKTEKGYDVRCNGVCPSKLETLNYDQIKSFDGRAARRGGQGNRRRFVRHPWTGLDIGGSSTPPIRMDSYDWMSSLKKR